MPKWPSEAYDSSQQQNQPSQQSRAKLGRRASAAELAMASRAGRMASAGPAGPGSEPTMLLSELRKLDNGAGFHNIDLHIHSYGASHDVKDSGMTAEAIVDSALKQGLRVIAITDHNSK